MKGPREEKEASSTKMNVCRRMEGVEKVKNKRYEVRMRERRECKVLQKC